MCSICRQTPCHPRCPNYEPVVAEICSECGAEIYEGDTMYVLGDKTYCEDCVSDGITTAYLDI